jgi:hypothetical protein
MSRIQVDNIFDKEGSGAPTFPAGSVVTGVSTATTFDGNFTGNVTGNITGDLTGNVTGNISGTAGGLSGTPDITVGIVTSSELDGYVMLDTSLF